MTKSDLNIDWESLDKFWADNYEEEYGYCFSNMYFYAVNNATSSQIELGIVNCAGVKG